jgi:hypothetical protein
MKKENADYVMRLDHEGGKGVALKDNKLALFNKDGNAIKSGSTRALGNAVKDHAQSAHRRLDEETVVFVVLEKGEARWQTGFSDMRWRYACFSFSKCSEQCRRLSQVPNLRNRPSAHPLRSVHRRNRHQRRPSTQT